MGPGSIAGAMKDVKMVAGEDGGKNGVAAYGGAGIGEIGHGPRAGDDAFRASEAFTNELDGSGKSGREELA